MVGNVPGKWITQKMQISSSLLLPKGWLFLLVDVSPNLWLEEEKKNRREAGARAEYPRNEDSIVPLIE